MLIQGGWSSDFSTRSEDPSLTIIDGDSTGDGVSDGRVFYIYAPNNIYVNIEGFIIRNGVVVNDNGGGIYVESPSTGIATVNLTNNIITSNRTNFGGGGILVYSSTDGGSTNVTLKNNIIENNQAGGRGGGVYVFSSYGGDNKVTLINNTLTNNTIVDDQDDGGGLAVFSFNSGSLANVEIKNTIIWGNTANGVDNDISLYEGFYTNTTVNASYSDIGEKKYLLWNI